ncbi:MAG: IS200/IS605 family transposase [Candidatus Taylorbacteria bacterium CG11_big_fil_rev_8_21_14_0_20_46_11]|uniref:IS200/IS605 family transposase n=1 Tax=Candidatus Taylorbacteria bacterium CG11_big_fil_rev_8_21_14_0_20_46_11 TaxID=1975025 RepID=A0A2H0KAW5_9BACT|nr:MAG: IS200/IS605 family transposase [Candidatus Taylorbacteria bacterium CG11_big_fil_rev_8_21_14_0_20_46_11]
MAPTNIDAKDGLWYWYHNVSECYYHVQITVKYRKSLFAPEVEKLMLGILEGFKERFAIDIHTVGFDQNHVHLLLRFLPKYGAGEVIGLLKSQTASQLFKFMPALKKELWGGEFWTDGYYVATISGRGDKRTIENYIKNQGREKDIAQLKLFDI